jgi:outer membrane lipoprotein carrier protein
LRAATAVAFLTLAATAAGAQDLAIVRKVDDHYNRLKTLRTRYAEHYAGMGMDRTERGTLELAKPGKMRWAYDVPAGKLFVLDGKYGWSYTPGDPQVERIPAKRLDDLRSPLRFLLGHTELKKELDGLAVSASGGGYRISGVPKGMAERVKLLVLQVDGDGAIQSMRLEEADGAVTEFSFSEMKENVPLNGKDFVFNPPPGVGVVDGLPPV